jgi:uncharacterized membrane protein YqjE
MNARAHRVRDDTITIEPAPEPTFASLLRQLIGDIVDLVRNEFALARSELKDVAGAARVGLISAAIAAVVLTVGVLALTAAVVLLLAQWMAPWIAALIVGGVLTIVGVGLLVRAKHQLDPSKLTMRKTRQSIGTDVEVVSSRLRSGS